MSSVGGPATKVLRVGLLARVHTVNPRDVRDRVSSEAVAQVFETPYVAAKGDGPAVPALFAAPLASEPGPGGGVVYSAPLRADAVFSDGTPLTARQAALSLARVDSLREQGVLAEARGEKVAFVARAPIPRLDLQLTLINCGVVLEKAGRPLGTGPYAVAPGATLEAMRLVRNPHDRRKASVDEVQFRVYPPSKEGKPEALIQALQSGEVDFTTMLSRTDAAAVTGVKKAFHPSNSTAILFINTERPDLKDAKVRRALTMAVDRLALTEVSYSNPLAFTASSLLPPTMATTRDTFGHDPERAKKELATAAARLSRLKLMTVWAPRPYLPNPQPVADALARQLSAVGVETEVVVPRSSDVFYDACIKGDYDLLLGGWIADTPDPADFLEALLRSDRVQTSQAGGVAAVNRSRYRNPAMDAALKRYREQPSPGNRDDVLRLVGEEAPLLPIMYGPTVVVHAWRVKNVEVSPVGVPNFAAFDLD